MSLTIDQQRNIETTQDIQDFLLEPSTTYPSGVQNNIPNSINTTGGEIAVWNGSTWALEGNTSLGIGFGAGLTFQGSNCVALGFQAGRHNQNNNSVAVGFNSGRTHQGTSAVSIGYLAGNSTQGQNSIAIGLNAGEIFQGANSVALGYRAGTFTQGSNSIAIGFNAGLTAQPANSIVINSSGSTVNGVTSSSCYIAPIRNVVTNNLTNNFLCYDDTNKEIIQASNIQYANPVSFPLGSATQNSVNFGTLNTGIFSSSANSINVSVAGTQRMDLTGSRLSLNVPVQNIAGTQSAPPLYFSTDSTSGLYRPATNNVAISTNSVLRFNVTTSAIACSLPLTLPTSGGTATNFDYYERTTQTMIMRYSSTATFNWTITLIRIGTNITYHFPDDVTLYTIANGPRAIQSETNTIPTRFRPSTNQATPYLYLDNTPTWISGKILINSDGSISITPLNGNFATGNTIYIQRHSSNVFI